MRSSTLHIFQALHNEVSSLEIYGRVEMDKSVHEKQLRWTWKPHERLRNGSCHSQPSIITIPVSHYIHLVGRRIPSREI
jgi:hypothetical protein